MKKLLIALLALSSISSYAQNLDVISDSVRSLIGANSEGNCFNAVLMGKNFSGTFEWTSSNDYLATLKLNRCIQIPNDKRKPGDIINLYELRNSPLYFRSGRIERDKIEVIHGAIYLGDDKVFQKKGMNPYSINPTFDLQRTYRRYNEKCINEKAPEKGACYLETTVRCK